MLFKEYLEQSGAHDSHSRSKFQSNSLTLMFLGEVLCAYADTPHDFRPSGFLPSQE